MAKNAGFCIGVQKAMEKAEEMLREEGVKYSLGELIHNPRVTEAFRDRGLLVAEDIREVPDKSLLIIRAHGEGPDTARMAREKQLRVYDATCSYVHNIQKLIAEKFKQGHRIILFGYKNHPEVIGINGYCENKAVVIGDVSEAMAYVPNGQDVCLIAQTTMVQEEYDLIHEILKKRIANLVKFDTICTATRKRQSEAAEMAKTADVMLVVGGKNSSNTCRLFEICREHCKNTFLIENTGDLSPIEIKDNMTVCITAGASTPDWVVKEVKEAMEEKEKQGEVFNFEQALEASLVPVKNGDVVKGRIISLNNNEVYVDLGFKIDGTIPIEEFEKDSEGNPMVKVGESIEALVVKVKESEGVVTLSKRRVDDRKKFEKIDELFETGEAAKVTVKEAVSGGLIVDVYGMDGFIPASQLSDRYVRNLDKYVGRKIKARIIENNRKKRKLILSRRVLIEEENEKLEREVWSNLEIGKTIPGKVKSFTSFGAFVDVGGMDGLIHITELSWNRIKHPSDVLEIGQEIEVIVKDFSKADKRISLGYKKAEDDVWYKADEKYASGTVVKGTVVRILPFGAFVQIEPGLDALVHISQISTRRINTPSEVLSEGMEIEMAIIDVDMEARKINASIKAVKPYDPEFVEEPPVEIKRPARAPEGERKPSRPKEKREPERLPGSYTENFNNTIGDILGKIDIKEKPEEDKE